MPQRLFASQRRIASGSELSAGERPCQRHRRGKLRRVHAGLHGEAGGEIGKLPLRHRKRPLRSKKGVLFVRADPERKADRLARP